MRLEALHVPLAEVRIELPRLRVREALVRKPDGVVTAHRPYSMTVSARTSTAGGIVMPSAFAVR